MGRRRHSGRRRLARDPARAARLRSVEVAPPRLVAPGWITDLVTSRDGRLVASADTDGQLRLYDTGVLASGGQGGAAATRLGLAVVRAGGRTLHGVFDGGGRVEMTMKPADWIRQACRLAAASSPRTSGPTSTRTSPGARPAAATAALPWKPPAEGARRAVLMDMHRHLPRRAEFTGVRRGHSCALALLTPACPPPEGRAGAAAGRGVRPAPPSPLQTSRRRRPDETTPGSSPPSLTA